MTLALPGTHTERASLYHCDYATLAAHMLATGIVADALIVDAPYSERTHAGHREGCAVDADPTSFPTSSIGRRRAQRKDLPYVAWTERDVLAFGASMRGTVRGWRVSITDHILSSAWEGLYASEGLYRFAPVAWLGATRPRLVGDGPCASACWLMVARPRTDEFRRWGALCVDYVIRERASDEGGIVGGKPISLMRAIVSDYSRRGDLVLDPCAGGGTTLVAAVETGRRAIGCEPDAGRYAIAAKRILAAREQRVLRLDVAAGAHEQASLLGGER